MTPKYIILHISSLFCLAAGIALPGMFSWGAIALYVAFFVLAFFACREYYWKANDRQQQLDRLRKFLEEYDGPKIVDVKVVNREDVGDVGDYIIRESLRTGKPITGKANLQGDKIEITTWQK